MATVLQPAVKGARHTAQVVTFGRQDSSEVVDLTSATVTGTIRDNVTKVVRAITGTTTGSGTTGLITWTYGAADVASNGDFEVQFKATYGDATYELSFPEPWKVYEAITV